MQQFAIMCTVSFETEVYVDAENLPQAMEILQYEGWINEIHHTEMPEDAKFTPLDFIKPQVWDEEAQDYVPCNVIMFPVKDEADEEMEFESDV